MMGARYPTEEYEGYAMVVSHDTALQIYESLMKIGLTDIQVDKLLKLLSDIPGNRSFRETIMRLDYLHNSYRNRGYRQGR